MTATHHLPRVAVVGDGDIAAGLDGQTGDGGPLGGVSTIDPSAVPVGSADCVVVDGRLDDWRAVLDATDPPAVLLVDGDFEDAVPAAIDAGAADYLPRSLVESDPGTVAERVADIVDREPPDDDRFHLVTESVDEIIYIANGDFSEIEYVDPSYEEVWGRPAEELYEDATAFVDGIDERDREEFLAEFEAMREDIRDGDPDDSYEFEFRVRQPDGEVRWVLAHGYPTGSGRYVGIAEDVTERRELERTFRGLFENVGDGIVVHEPDTGEIVEVNEEFCRMNGYDREELVGATVDLLTPDDEGFDYEHARERIRRAREEGPQLFEWRNERADGETFPVEVQLSYATFRGEERVIASVRDISERKTAEQRFQTIVERIDAGVMLVAEGETEPAYLNPVYEELTGIPVEELYDPSTFLERIHPDDREGYVDDVGAMIDDILAGEAADRYEFEFRFERADGETRWFHWTGYPLLEEDNDYWYVGMTTDVTERRERQARVRENERTYRELFNKSSAAITLHDPDTKEMVGVNDTMCELLGYDRETVLELDVDGVSVTGEGFSMDRGAELIDRIMASGEPEEYEWLLEDADGERHWMLVTGTPATINGERRFLATSQEITERKRREREYEQIFDGVNDAIAVHDPDTGDMLAVNERLCELTGYDRETLLEIGADGLTVATEEFAPERVPEVIDRVMAGEELDPYEQAIETADGDRRWLEVNPTRAVVEGEERFLAISRDVTERRERQQRLEAERDRRSVLFENTPDPIMAVEFVDGEPYITEVNSAFEAAFGIDTATVTDRPISEAVVPDSEREGYERIRKQALAGERVNTEVRRQTADGVRDFLLRVLPFEINGERRAYVWYTDITERKRRERAIEEERQKYSTLVEQSTDGVAVVRDGGYVFVNEQFVELTGYDEAELLELPFDEVFTPSSRELVRERYERRIEGEDVPSQYDVELETADGDRRTLELSVSRITHEGEPATLANFRDVTERRERERTVESFHDATAELTTADTVTEAGRIACEAAADVFDIPATAVYHYDEEAASLEARATGPATPDPGELPTVTADDAAVWETFVGETMRRVDDADAPALAVGGETALLFPLGGNGVLVVWGAEETFDTDAASILAATLEAALNRLRGERQLERRREELAEQTERARRLESIAELTRRVEAAITTRSSRQGIVEAVCEELVDVEPFSTAWVAAAEVGADRLTPRAVAGADRDHAEQALAGDGDRSDPHPAVDAWRTGDPRVVNELVGGGRRSDWRRQLLRDGAGAACAVPVAYSGITYGVLAVVADEPGAFGDREVDVLSQLGTSVGYAITAVERQRALESDDTLELEFRGTDMDVPFARLAREFDCRVRHERTIRRQDGSVSVYYTLAEGVPDAVGDRAGDLLPGEVAVVSRGDGEAVLERRGSSWFGSLVSEYGGVLRRGRATGGGVELVVELPREADTRTIVERLQAEFPALELVAQRQHRETDATPGEVRDRLERRLSDRQQEALETAHAMGYFDWPRESSGEEVAETLDITQPTVNKHIRLGERKVFDLLFGDGE